MNLEVAAIYLPDADEVQVDFSSTLDDLTTVTIADTLTVELQAASTNLAGTQTFSQIAVIAANPTYIQPQNHYALKFRHPRRRKDLFVNITAGYGVNTYTKQVPVGEGISPQTSMDLPDNVLSTYDPFKQQSGGPFLPPNKNQVVLNPLVQIYVNEYKFTSPQPVENFSSLGYTGGGNRLFLTNLTNNFVLQQPNASPWSESAFLFLERAATNLLPNAFFLTYTDNIPASYGIDPAGTFLIQTVETGNQTSLDANTWKMRFRQYTPNFSNNEAVVSIISPVSISPITTYTFSSYIKVSLMTSVTQVKDLTLLLKWYSGSTFLTMDEVSLPIKDYSSLSLASFTSTSPAGADKVFPEIRLGSIDSGDDVELTLFAPQLEEGTTPTSRTWNGPRLEDYVLVDNYNSADQKIRFEMIPGFSSSPSSDIAITAGPLVLTFTATGDFKAEIPGEAFLSTPLSFSSGELLDLTISHKAGEKLIIYQSGNILAETILPAFTAIPSPLTFLGIGAEILNLYVFSRV